MAKNLDHILAALPTERRAGIETRAAELATLKDLRQTKTVVDAGSGDVFLDLGYADAAERKLHVQLASELTKLSRINA